VTLHRAEWEMLLRRATMRKYPRGQLLFERHDEGHCAFLVTEGEVEIFLGDGARRTMISRKYDGDLFGELSVLFDRPRMASACTVCRTELATISRAAFRACHAESTALQEAIREHLVILLEEATLRLSTVHHGAYGRLRVCLCTFDEGGQLPGQWTQQRLADWAGCTRETVGKILGELTRGGWIRCERGRITILKPLPPSF
jgi:CRP/FNR family transcriptional regulator, cyclic AMP receptor protein